MRAALVLAIALVACGSPPAAHHAPGPAAKLTRGYATWYGQGQMTASGERFDKHALTAAHRTLPIGTRVRVTNRATAESVVVRINDRGPYGGTAGSSTCRRRRRAGWT